MPIYRRRNGKWAKAPGHLKKSYANGGRRRRPTRSPSADDHGTRQGRPYHASPAGSTGLAHSWADRGYLVFGIFARAGRLANGASPLPVDVIALDDDDTRVADDPPWLAAHGAAPAASYLRAPPCTARRSATSSSSDDACGDSGRGLHIYWSISMTPRRSHRASPRPVTSGPSTTAAAFRLDNIGDGHFGATSESAAGPAACGSQSGATSPCADPKGLYTARRVQGPLLAGPRATASRPPPRYEVDPRRCWSPSPSLDPRLIAAPRMDTPGGGVSRQAVHCVVDTSEELAPAPRRQVPEDVGEGGRNDYHVPSPGAETARTPTTSRSMMAMLRHASTTASSTDAARTTLRGRARSPRGAVAGVSAAVQAHP